MITSGFELLVGTELTLTQGTGMELTRGQQKNGNKFKLYSLFMDFLASLEIFRQMKSIPSILFREIFGFHDRLFLLFPLVACLHRSV